MEVGNGPAPKAKRMKKSDGDPKNPLQTLNEMVPRLKYDCTQSGLHHEPTFTVQVTVNDHVCAIPPLQSDCLLNVTSIERNLTKCHITDSCHTLRWQIYLSAASAEQAHSLGRHKPAYTLKSAPPTGECDCYRVHVYQVWCV